MWCSISTQIHGNNASKSSHLCRFVHRECTGKEHFSLLQVLSTKCLRSWPVKTLQRHRKKATFPRHYLRHCRFLVCVVFYSVSCAPLSRDRGSSCLVDLKNQTNVTRCRPYRQFELYEKYEFSIRKHATLQRLSHLLGLRWKHNRKIIDVFCEDWICCT
jgi:hypothetical protein